MCSEWCCIGSDLLKRKRVRDKDERLVVVHPSKKVSASKVYFDLWDSMSQDYGHRNILCETIRRRLTELSNSICPKVC